MLNLKRLTGSAILLCLATWLMALPIGAQAASSSRGGVACHGRFYDPITDTNWDDFLPISIMGVTYSNGSEDPPLMEEPPVCVCPSHFFGIPMIGIGITFWEPNYIAEITRDPGCLITLGGKNILPEFATEMGPVQKGGGKDDDSDQSREQVHWYVYPVFSLLRLFTDFVCLNSSGFQLADLTEIDPFWQNDEWGAVLSPEAILFANPIAQSMCIVDAVASTFWYPLDPMFWCAGAWGGIYPFTGNSPTTESDQSMDGLVLTKYLAWSARLGLLSDTIGPQAECFSGPMPILIKSEFRIDPIFPLPTFGAPIYIGESEFEWGLSPPENFPAFDDEAYLLWTGVQCCLRT
ncbi:TraU family protein [Thiomonas sp.]